MYTIKNSHTNAGLDRSSCEVSAVFSYFKGNRSVSTDLSKNSKIQKFAELFPVGVAELNAKRSKDVTTDGQDKVVSCYMLSENA